MEQRQHKIFISHNSKDQEFASAFVHLFRAMGLKRNEIVCSSVSGYGIPIGEDIYEWLKKQFQEFDLHVIILNNFNCYIIV